MIVYKASKSTFCNDCFDGVLTSKIHGAFVRYLGRDTSPAEIQSWENSLIRVCMVLNTPEIPGNSTVAVEFQVPLTSKRIDCIIAGKNERQEEHVVIIELKQWQKSTMTGMDGIVNTYFHEGYKDVPHPSYQAWSYATTIQNFCETVTVDNIGLHPCAYLHNYVPDGVIDNPFYAKYTDQAPVFLQPDAERLRQYIKQFIKQDDTADILYRIENGRIVPSKHLADVVTSMLCGNEEFKMIDDQKVAYETALGLVDRAKPDCKQVLIVKGGPGTGKSVLAINLLSELTNRRKLSKYVSKNSAPRNVYKEKLATNGVRRREIDALFCGSGCFIETEPNLFDCLIVDEAHRLNLKSGMYQNQGENQIAEIIEASKSSIFFVDDHQQIHVSDIGTSSYIEKIARQKHAVVHILQLNSQFRCNGSDGYLAWIDNTLQITQTANVHLSPDDFDFRIFDDPVELLNTIRQKNLVANKARMVAGYCWNWEGKNDPFKKDVAIDGTGFAMPWNLASDSTWAISENSIEQIGCIHTSQGLELDYVGVIVGPDIRYENGRVITDVSRRASSDKSVFGWKKRIKEDPVNETLRFDKIIRNTYRTLLTRGMKGCYVYFCDRPLSEYFAGQLVPQDTVDKPIEQANDIRVEGDVNDDVKFVEYLPLYTMRAACGYFGNGELVEPNGWIKVSGFGRLNRNKFIVRACGDSMLPKIKNGDYCVFDAMPAGSRQGKIVLVQYNQKDIEYGGAYTIKQYTSTKSVNNSDVDSQWQHESIVLKPLNPSYAPIILPATAEDDYRIIGEFAGVV